ncbi:hypothetical protein BaOVIS_025970 [Babesia ovis]|uniref:C3H1-type domain-containing protein n=1 Tax=Babesia ovis TaxID=5869 RepID=A0A9W5TCC0_BABOV|nr:hypothetical protein BaOVIS_025970 [Babesia ovis]
MAKSGASKSNNAMEKVDPSTLGKNGHQEASSMKHVCLMGKDLEEFRTKQCPLYVKGLCQDSVRCNMSHSETWPRRNPATFKYDYKLCPNIQFFRMYNKMQLQGKCHYGRRCRYSHSKEEQLYHPDLYKTRMCLNYPDCKGYFCPFAHSKAEMRDRKETHSKDKNRGHKFDHKPKKQEANPLAQTQYVQAETTMRELQSQMIDDTMQYICNEEYKGIESNSLNTTVGSPGTMATREVSSIMDFDLNATLGDTLRLNDEENNIHVVNNYLAQMAENAERANTPRNVETGENATTNMLWSRSQTETADDDEGDGWLDAVLQRGLKLLSEDDDSSSKPTTSSTSSKCIHCENPQEMCNHNDNLEQNWWM